MSGYQRHHNITARILAGEKNIHWLRPPRAYRYVAETLIPHRIEAINFSLCFGEVIGYAEVDPAVYLQMGLRCSQRVFYLRSHVPDRLDGIDPWIADRYGGICTDPRSVAPAQFSRPPSSTPAISDDEREALRQYQEANYLYHLHLGHDPEAWTVQAEPEPEPLPPDPEPEPQEDHVGEISVPQMMPLIIPVAKKTLWQRIMGSL